jgi:hypothetical protein
MLLGALAGAPSWSQEPAPPAGQAPATPEARFEELVKRYQDRQNAAYEAYSKATTDEEKKQALDGLPGKEFVPEFRALAEENRSSEVGAKCWIWVLRLVQDDDKEQAVETLEVLLAENLQATALDELTSELRYADHVYGHERVVEALWRIGEGSPHRKVQAAAFFTLGALLVESRSGDKAAGRELLERIVVEYADVSYWGRSTYGKEAQGFLYELDHLQVGMVAPDFSTTDENGVAWKLSDYKGKVVVVDFWGFW